jgi:hypothetical protein
VTLDDLATQPVGTKKGTRWTVRIVVIVAAVGLIWALVMAVQAFSDPFAGSDEVAQNADGPLEQIGTEIGALFAAAILFLFLIAIISLIAGVAGALGIAGLLTSRSLRRAERDQWTRVRSRVELTEFLDNVRRTQSKLFAPRIAVLRTVDELWRDAVAGLADIADVALIDISDPSEALLWELQMLDRRPDVEVVLIGEASRVEALHRTGGHDADDRAVVALLGPRPVLTYSRDRKRFAAELHNMLEVAMRRRRGQ